MKKQKQKTQIRVASTDEAKTALVRLLSNLSKSYLHCTFTGDTQADTRLGMQTCIDALAQRLDITIPPNLLDQNGNLESVAPAYMHKPTYAQKAAIKAQLLKYVVDGVIARPHGFRMALVAAGIETPNASATGLQAFANQLANANVTPSNQEDSSEWRPGIRDLLSENSTLVDVWMSIGPKYVTIDGKVDSAHQRLRVKQENVPVEKMQEWQAKMVRSGEYNPKYKAYSGNTQITKADFMRVYSNLLAQSPYVIEYVVTAPEKVAIWSNLKTGTKYRADKDTSAAAMQVEWIWRRVGLRGVTTKVTREVTMQELNDLNSVSTLRS